MHILTINNKSVQELEQHITNENYHTEKQQVFIIGSKGIPANYGGFETFVEKLTEGRQSDRIRYHVARLAKDEIRFEYNGAKCFDVKVPKIGPAKAIYYDIAALRKSIRYCKNRPCIKSPVFLILACRIGPFLNHYKKEIKKLGGVLYVNPDGHEWARRKWNAPIRRYWKYSEKLTVKHADLLICDSKNIEKYIQTEYKEYRPKTAYIAYGSETKQSLLSDDSAALGQWYAKYDLKAKQYYLIVGRFVPENNFDVIIREFMKSKTDKSLAVVTTANPQLKTGINRKLHFSGDPRIKFVDAIYDQEMLKKIRENAYGYLHGHEVGGTNPSLLEALGSTDLNLLLDVKFNREVGEDAALYWTKDAGNLAALLDSADTMTDEETALLGAKAKRRISAQYSWPGIIRQYEAAFLNAAGH